MNMSVVSFLRESNAIEGVYDKDSFQQALDAWEYLMKQSILTQDVILKTHKILMLHQSLQPDQKGYWRKIYVQVGNRICPDPQAVPNLVKEWLKNDISVKQLPASGKHLANFTKERHVEFEAIHPFVDGNGRIGRMLMNWQRIKIGLPILVIKEAEKQKYYEWFE